MQVVMVYHSEQFDLLCLVHKIMFMRIARQLVFFGYQGYRPWLECKFE